MTPSGTIKLVLWEEAFRSALVQERLESVSFENLLDNLDQQLKRGLLMPGMLSLAVGGNTISPDEKSSLKVHLWTYLYYKAFCCGGF